MGPARKSAKEKRKKATASPRQKQQKRKTARKRMPASPIHETISNLRSDLSMCMGCDAPCCSLRPELTTYDVARIMELEGKTVLDFVDFVDAARDDALPIAASGRRVKMTLRKKDGVCMFFDRSSHLKCSINHSKPAVCLAYPYGFSKKLGSNVMCPPDNLSKAEADVRLDALRDSEWEHARYKEIVSDWNSGKGGAIADFMLFAAKEMDAEKSPIGSALRHARRGIIGIFRKRSC